MGEVPLVPESAHGAADRSKEESWGAAQSSILTADEYSEAVRAIFKDLECASEEKAKGLELKSALRRLLQTRNDPPLPLWWTFISMEKALGLDRNTKDPLEFGAGILKFSSRVLESLKSLSAVNMSGCRALSATAPILGLLFDVATLVSKSIGPLEEKNPVSDVLDGKGKKVRKLLTKLKELVREMLSITFLWNCRGLKSFRSSSALPPAPNVASENFPSFLYPAFPLASKSMAKSLSRSLCDATVMTAVVSVEEVLLQLVVEIIDQRRRLKAERKVFSVGQYEFVEALKHLAVHSIWAARTLSLPEMLLDLMLEKRLPALDLLDVKEQTLIRVVLFEALLVDLPLFSFFDEGDGQSMLLNGDLDHHSVVFMKQIAVARRAVAFYRSQEERSRLGSLSARMTSWLVPPQLLKWLKSQKKQRVPGAALHDNRALTNWLVNTAEESAFRPVFDKSVAAWSHTRASEVTENVVELHEVMDGEDNLDDNAEEALFFVDTAGEKETEMDVKSAADLEFTEAAKSMRGINDRIKEKKKKKKKKKKKSKEGSNVLFHRYEQVSTGTKRLRAESDDLQLHDSSSDEERDQGLGKFVKKRIRRLEHEEGDGSDENDLANLEGQALPSVNTDDVVMTPLKSSQSGGQFNQDSQFLQKTDIPDYQIDKKASDPEAPIDGAVDKAREGAVEEGAAQVQYLPTTQTPPLLADLSQDLGTESVAFVEPFPKTLGVDPLSLSSKKKKGTDLLIDASGAVEKVHEESILETPPVNSQETLGDEPLSHSKRRKKVKDKLKDTSKASEQGHKQPVMVTPPTLVEPAQEVTGIEPSSSTPSVLEPSSTPSALEPSPTPSVLEPLSTSLTVTPVTVEPSSTPTLKPFSTPSMGKPSSTTTKVKHSSTPTTEPSFTPSMVEPSSTPLAVDPSSTTLTVEPSSTPSTVEISLNPSKVQNFSSLLPVKPSSTTTVEPSSTPPRVNLPSTAMAVEPSCTASIVERSSLLTVEPSSTPLTQVDLPQDTRLSEATNRKKAKDLKATSGAEEESHNRLTDGTPATLVESSRGKPSLVESSQDVMTAQSLPKFSKRQKATDLAGTSGAKEHGHTMLIEGNPVTLLEMSREVLGGEPSCVDSSQENIATESLPKSTKRKKARDLIGTSGAEEQGHNLLSEGTPAAFLKSSQEILGGEPSLVESSQEILAPGSLPQSSKRKKARDLTGTIAAEEQCHNLLSEGTPAALGKSSQKIPDDEPPLVETSQEIMAPGILPKSGKRKKAKDFNGTSGALEHCHNLLTEGISATLVEHSPETLGGEPSLVDSAQEVITAESLPKSSKRKKAKNLTGSIRAEEQFQNLPSEGTPVTLVESSQEILAGEHSPLESSLEIIAAVSLPKSSKRKKANDLSGTSGAEELRHNLPIESSPTIVMQRTSESLEGEPSQEITATGSMPKSSKRKKAKDFTGTPGALEQCHDQLIEGTSVTFVELSPELLGGEPTLVDSAQEIMATVSLPKRKKPKDLTGTNGAEEQHHNLPSKGTPATLVEPSLEIMGGFSSPMESTQEIMVVESLPKSSKRKKAKDLTSTSGATAENALAMLFQDKTDSNLDEQLGDLPKGRGFPDTILLHAQNIAPESVKKGSDKSPANGNGSRVTPDGKSTAMPVTGGSLQMGMKKRSKQLFKDKETEAGGNLAISSTCQVTVTARLVAEEAQSKGKELAQASTGSYQQSLCMSSATPSSLLTRNEGRVIFADKAGGEGGDEITPSGSIRIVRKEIGAVLQMKLRKQEILKDSPNDWDGEGEYNVDKVTDMSENHLVTASVKLPCVNPIDAVQAGQTLEVDKQIGALKVANLQKSTRLRDQGDKELPVGEVPITTEEVAGSVVQSNKKKTSKGLQGVSKEEPILLGELEVNSNGRSEDVGCSTEGGSSGNAVNLPMAIPGKSPNEQTKLRTEGTPDPPLQTSLKTVDQLQVRQQGLPAAEQQITKVTSAEPESDTVRDKQTSSRSKKRSNVRVPNGETEEPSQVKEEVCVPSDVISSAKRVRVEKDESEVDMKTTPNAKVNDFPPTSGKPSSRKKKPRVEVAHSVGSASSEERLSPRRTRSGRPLGTLPPTPNSRRTNMKRNLVLGTLEEET